MSWWALKIDLQYQRRASLGWRGNDDVAILWSPIHQAPSTRLRGVLKPEPLHEPFHHKVLLPCEDFSDLANRGAVCVLKFQDDVLKRKILRLKVPSFLRAVDVLYASSTIY